MKRFSSSGYTLIELLVVVAIMAIISGSLIAFNHLGQDQVTLYVEASKVVDVILRAKSLAISAYREPGGRAPCAHGLHVDLAANPAESFSLNRYFKKEDAFPCMKLEERNSPLNLNSYDRLVAESSTYTLASGIVFDQAGTTASDIIFRPPDPQIFFFTADGSRLNSPSTTIIIRAKNGGSGRMRITIGQGGQVTYNFID